MSAICLPKLINQMDGFFGCNVSIEKSKEGEQEFSFKKKTLFDLIKNIFSSSDSVKTDREATVQALKAVSTHLDPEFKSKLDTLVEGYESGKANIDFKEVRKVLRSSLPRNSTKFPPVVYSKNASVGGGLWGRTEFQASKTSETSNFVSIKPLASTPAIYQSTREKEFEKLTARWTVVPTTQDFKIIYQQKLVASIFEKIGTIEISCDPDGTVSDENLAILAETIIEKEKETGNRFRVSVTKEDYEEFILISERMDQAFVDYAAEHGKYRNQELEQDFAKLQSELFQSRSQYETAPLNTLNTSRW